jgi:sodium transport system permease protein
VTAASLQHAEPRSFSAALVKLAAVAAGTGLLLARPTIAVTLGWSIPIVVVVFATVLALGLAPPTGHDRTREPLPSMNGVLVLGAGALVFVAARLAAGGHNPAPATTLLVALNTLAAIGEEALFRRLTFDALLPAGPIAAVSGSALLFGLAHVTVYGWWAFPLDVAAGVVFGWQRWASGTWTIPAATHALADLLVVI